MRGGWGYIVTNQPNGTLYLGVTSNLAQRAWQYRTGAIEGFTKRYGLGRLVGASIIPIFGTPSSGSAP